MEKGKEETIKFINKETGETIYISQKAWDEKVKKGNDNTRSYEQTMRNLEKKGQL